MIGKPGLTGGGGGLYCKSQAKYQGFSAGKFSDLTREAKQTPGLSSTQSLRIDQGRFFTVKSNAATPAERAKICLIMWHEFGHAVYDDDKGEYSALKFELHAIDNALETNKLPDETITRERIRAFVDTRSSDRSAMTTSKNKSIFEGLVTSVLDKLVVDRLAKNDVLRFT